MRSTEELKSSRNRSECKPLRTGTSLRSIKEEADTAGAYTRLLFSST